MIQLRLIPLLALAALAACDPADGVGNAPPPKPDTDYVARGQEPGWLLRIEGDDLIYEGDYGETLITARDAEARPSFNGWRYYSDRLTVDITHSPCADAMSGQRYADTVMVTADGKDVRGCGGEQLPPESLSETSWRILSVDGVDVQGQRPAELAFADGRMSGSAGCNRFNGTYSATDTTLTVGPLAMTRMACIGPGAEQEAAFTAMLEGPVALRFRENGQLILSGNGHSAVLERVI